MTRASAFLAGLSAMLVSMVASTPSAQAFAFRHVFIANRGANAVVELDENLQFVRSWFGQTTYDGTALNGPNALAFSPDGSLWVADTFNSRVVVFGADGVFLRQFPVGDRVGDHVETINFDLEGKLYAAGNVGNGTIARFSNAGVFEQAVVSGETWRNAGNINFTVSGDLIYSVYNTMGLGYRVLNRTDGALLATFGGGTTDQIEDMAVDGADMVCSAVWNKDEVAVFNTDRTERRRIRATGMRRPTGIAITHDCKILVTSFAAAATEPQLFVFNWDGTLNRSVTVPDLSMAESIAIEGQILPGSFGEFPPEGNEVVPVCDLYIGTDAGVDDAALVDGGRDGGRNGGPDAGSEFGLATGRGCQCSLVAGPVSSPLAAAIVVCLSVALRRRRKSLAPAA